MAVLIYAVDYWNMENHAYCDRFHGGRLVENCKIECEHFYFCKTNVMSTVEPGMTVSNFQISGLSGGFGFWAVWLLFVEAHFI
eukprot:12058305-Ditylum_brightwellii.AAC.1